MTFYFERMYEVILYLFNPKSEYCNTDYANSKWNSYLKAVTYSVVYFSENRQLVRVVKEKDLN